MNPYRYLTLTLVLFCAVTSLAETPELYRILNVSTSATPHEIKHQFRLLAKRFHPDLNKNANAAQSFKKINEAYEVLSDPKRRKEYDASSLKTTPTVKNDSLSLEKKLLLEAAQPIDSGGLGIREPSDQAWLLEKLKVLSGAQEKQLYFNRFNETFRYGKKLLPLSTLQQKKLIWRMCDAGASQPEAIEQFNRSFFLVLQFLSGQPSQGGLQIPIERAIELSTEILQNPDPLDHLGTVRAYFNSYSIRNFYRSGSVQPVARTLSFSQALSFAKRAPKIGGLGLTTPNALNFAEYVVRQTDPDEFLERFKTEFRYGMRYLGTENVNHPQAIQNSIKWAKSQLALPCQMARLRKLGSLMGPDPLL